jgi:hypothetical protein
MFGLLLWQPPGGEAVSVDGLCALSLPSWQASETDWNQGSNQPRIAENSPDSGGEKLE